MRKPLSSMLAIAALTMTAACARTSTVESTGEVVPATAVNANSLPTGSVVTVTLDQPVGTKTSKVGDTFSATVSDAIVASNGQTVVPAGSKVYGQVTGLQDSDNVGQKAAIRLDFERININGAERPSEANSATTQRQEVKEEARNETLKKAGIGAAAGAVLGAGLGGGAVSKILGGAAIGEAAGTVISLGGGDVEAVLPA